MHKTKFFSHFQLFLACNIAFFISQIALVFSAHKNLVYFFSMPVSLNIDLLQAVCVHMGLYTGLSLIQAFLMPEHKSEKYIVLIWSSTAGAILAANALYFPHSVTAQWINILIPPGLRDGILGVTLGILSILVIRAVCIFMQGTIWKTILPCILLLSGGLYWWPEKSVVITDQPNIILIGIDSLPGNQVTQQNMPRLTALVNQSVHFTDSISPLAKTHPAWMSILTGLYPAHHGALENLVPDDIVQNKASIAWILQQNGYQTWFATDEKRFSNIASVHGFQQTLGPRFGINDFIIGLLNDFPLTNLLINNTFSGKLFPYNYLNRASAHSYYPDTFNAKLQNKLNTHTADKPLFLSVHFTLPHWPYHYASSSQNPDDTPGLYRETLAAVDKQVHALYITLQKKGLLDNSLLIFLSDHGETLGTPGSRPLDDKKYQGGKTLFQHYLAENFAMDLDKSFGHGSDLLSPAQFQTLLAMQLRKNGKNQHISSKRLERVALIDIAPTIMDFLQIDNTDFQGEGISLMDTLLNPAHPLPARAFFLESGLLPNVSLSIAMLTDALRDLYVIENQALHLRKDKLAAIHAQKLFGIIENDWLLALYPTKNQYIPVIYQFSTGLWSDAPESAFMQNSPFQAMHAQLKAFYQQSFILVN